MRQLRVLVAEDNEDHRFLTMRALRDVQGVDIDVEGVRDGEEALLLGGQLARPVT